MTPTAAAAPSINTRRAFLERCARGDNTARHRINLHAVPLLFSFILYSIIPCFSSVLSPYSPLLFPSYIPAYPFLLFFLSSLPSYPLIPLALIPLSSSFLLPFALLSFSPFSSFISPYSLLSYSHIFLFLHTPSSHTLSLQPSHKRWKKIGVSSPGRTTSSERTSRNVHRAQIVARPLESRLLTMPSPSRKVLFENALKLSILPSFSSIRFLFIFLFPPLLPLPLPPHPPIPCPAPPPPTLLSVTIVIHVCFNV